MISVTILAKNCAETLEATLESVKRFDEVLLYDTGSSDKTLEIAARYPNVKIVHEAFLGFGPSHNRASAMASHDWILSIDSDEVLSPSLLEEIISLSLDPSCVYSIDRHNYFNGKWIRCCAGWYPDRITRLYNKKKTTFSNDAVHEKVLTNGLKVLPLLGALNHTPYRSIEAFLTKMQTYSTLFAEQNAGKKKSSLLKALGHAWASFFKNFILKGGIFGGKEGWIISFYNAHTTFYKYLKLAFKSHKL